MFCRLCVTESTDCTNIFENDEHELNLPNLISSYFTFNVIPDDEHSTIICSSCLNNLRNFNSFCEAVEKAQEKWQINFELDIKDESDDQLGEQLELVEEYFSDNSDVKNDSPVPPKESEFKSPRPNNKEKSKKSTLSEHFDRLIASHSKLFCSECHEPMETFKALKKHFKEIHKKSGYQICCKRKFFRAADLSDHIELHLNPDFFKCQICEKCFSSRYSLDFHLKTSHVKEEGTTCFKCKHCPRKFLTSTVAEKHELSHEIEATETQNHLCNKCGKSYPSESKLKAHDFNVHTMVYSRMCHLCGKNVRGNKALERHQLTHLGIKPKVQCIICSAELSTKGILKAHMIALHPEDSNVTYQCKICGKMSPSQRALKNHMDYVHKCERSHKCNFCDKSFKKTQALKEHMTTHTGDRLYECPHCPKTFKVRSNMHHHRKKKHPKEFEETRRKRIENKETNSTD